MGWREWADSILAAGLGPEDAEYEEIDPPTDMVVYWMSPVRFVDVDTGEEIIEDAPSCRAFPLFCAEKAGWRFKAYAERRWGSKNVWVEYQ